MDGVKLKGLPSEVKFTKKDWEEHLLVQIASENKIKELQEQLEKEKQKLKNSMDRFDYLVSSLENSYNLMNKPPEGSRYKIFIQKDSCSDRKPTISFKPM